MKDYRRVQVTWLDTRDEPSGWRSTEVKPEVAIARDMGFIISKSDNILVIASSVIEDSEGVELGKVTHIPMGCVTAVEDV